MNVSIAGIWTAVLLTVSMFLLAGCNGNGGGNADTSGDAGAGQLTASLNFTRPQHTIDLANYTLAHKYDLPVATTGSNLLADEASAVTYDKDSDSLFVVGDGGTAIVRSTRAAS